MKRKLFYRNIGFDNASIDVIQKALELIRRKLDRLIKANNVEEYAMRWEETVRHRYKLKNIEKVIVEKGNDIIRVYESYSDGIALLNHEWKSINFHCIKVGTDYFDIIPLNNNPKEGDTLQYRGNQVKWEFVEKQIEINKNTVLNDWNGRSIKPLCVQKAEDAFIVYLPPEVSTDDIELFLGGRKLKVRRINTSNEIPKKLLPFDVTTNSIIRNEVCVKDIRTHEVVLEEELKSKFLIDERHNLYRCEKAGEEIWLTLVDDAHDGDDSRIDMFIKMIEGAGEPEIWISPQSNKDGRIKVFRVDWEEGSLCVERIPSVEKVYPPRNTYHIKQQKKAIESLLWNPSPEHYPLLQVFEDYKKAEFPDLEDAELKEWVFLNKEDFEGIQEQREFVRRAMAMPDFTLLEGPPGSGKTTAIAELIYQLVNSGKRVLLVSSTHVAVDNVIEKLYERFDGQLKEKGIVPLRVGLEERVSETILEYQMQRRFEQMKEAVHQAYINEDLTDEELHRFAEEMVINTSNIVCGTTLGILQYPPFRKQNGIVKPEFDYMIIDEASKCTLLEFMVPALYAKRWVVVGDVRQLAPYMDTNYISLLIDSVIEGETSLKRALLIYFSVFYKRRQGQRGSYPPSVIVVENREVLKTLGTILPQKIQEIRKEHFRDRIKNCYLFVVTDELGKDLQSYRLTGQLLTESELDKDIRSVIKVNNAYRFNIILVEDEVYEKWKSILPETHILLIEDTLSNQHNYRFLYWADRMQLSLRTKGGTITEPEKMIEELHNMLLKTNWSEEIAWRLKRLQELEFAPEKGNKFHYRADLFALMPPKLSMSSGKNPYYEVQNIAGFFMPSILKALQEGLLPDWKDEKHNSVFYQGLPEDVIKTRLIRLIYQNRMHPEISHHPRELFYQDQALHDSGFVRNGGRQWDYHRYPGRLHWIDVRGAKTTGNQNPEEARIIIRELQEFIRWAKEKQPERYNVMILTFHEAQRRYIRDLLRNLYPENRKKQTQFRIEDIDVRLYTVDRAQGKEADIVFIGMTLNTRVGFLDSPNRLNVAMTRAKYQLVMVGDLAFYCNQHYSPVLKDMAESIKMSIKQDL